LWTCSNLLPEKYAWKKIIMSTFLKKLGTQKPEEPDFYSEGDGKVIYMKILGPSTE